MLNIDIVGGYSSDGSLDFEENGNPSNGNSSADRGWRVQWKVRPGCNVKEIHSITIKKGPGVPPSTDIFSRDKPKPQGGTHNTHWKATVNSDAKYGDEYHYDINWIEKGNTQIWTCDPKISVNPPLLPSSRKLHIGVILGLLGLLSLGLLISRRSGK